MFKYVIILITSFCFFSSLHAKDVFHYKFSKYLVSRGELIYEIEKSNKKNSSYKLTSTTKVFVLGKLKKKIDQVSLNRKDLSPVVSSYCNWPLRDGVKYLCSTVEYNAGGTFSRIGLNGETTDLDAFSNNHGEVINNDILTEFPEYVVGKDHIYDIASFIFLPRFIDVESSSGRSFFIFLEKTRVKVLMKTEKYKGDLYKVAFITAANTPDKIRNFIPSYVIYSKKENLVTEVLLPSNYGKVLVKLDKKRSSY